MSDDLVHKGLSAATAPEGLDGMQPDLPGRMAGEETTLPLAGSGTAGHTGPRYRLLGPLGIGGMGIVYRAEDTLLRRTVALKFLPPTLVPNPQAKTRFLNEARAAAALDHPNICTVYEVGETAEGQLYLAMACYEGETLKRRLERGPLSVSEALNITLQVANGLAKAHRHGIVHRDIKPANLMITADGIVKILDFGIAKLPAQAAAGPFLGTPAYMSPEQERGGEVDARSDVWSLGVVLCEMLAGREEAFTSLRQTAPPEVVDVLSHMCAEEPADRYPDAAALLSDLSALERKAAGGDGRIVRRRLRAIVAVLATALAVLGGYWFLRGRAPGLTTFNRLTDLPGKEWYPSLSPDGNSFLYTKVVGGRSHLFLQRVGGGNALDLLPDSTWDDTQPAYSRDGKQIAFRSERDGGGIFVMGATGESVRRVTDFGFNPAWSPDGKEILCATEGIVNPRIRRHRSEIFRVDRATGKKLQLYRGDAAQPNESPHGFRIAFWGISDSGQRIISTIPSRGGEAIRVTNGQSVDWNPVWSPDGSYLYFASDRSGAVNLWRVRIEEFSGQVLGQPEPVTTSAQASMLLSISRDGRRIAYASGNSKTIIEKVGFDPVSGTTTGPTSSITQTSQIIFTFDASRDGNWLVFSTTVPQEDLFLVHPDGTGLRQLTNDGFNNRHPSWSPDSRSIAFYSNRGGKYESWIIRTDGSRLEQATAIPGRPVFHTIWSPKKAQLACAMEENEALIDLAVPLAKRRPLLLPSPGRGLGFSASSWSADGRWLAGFLHRQNGPRVPGIVLYSLTDRRYVRVTDRGDSPYWMSDSRRLLYSEGDALFLLDTPSRKSKPFLTAPPGSAYNDFSLSPDDRVLYLVHSMDEGSIWLLTMK